MTDKLSKIEIPYFINSGNKLVSLSQFLKDKPFAVSAPIQLGESFLIGVSWGSLESSTCIHLPLSELPSFSQSLFNLKDSQIYVHAFKEIIKWVCLPES